MLNFAQNRRGLLRSPLDLLDLGIDFLESFNEWKVSTVNGNDYYYYYSQWELLWVIPDYYNQWESIYSQWETRRMESIYSHWFQWLIWDWIENRISKDNDVTYDISWVIMSWIVFSMVWLVMWVKQCFFIHHPWLGMVSLYHQNGFLTGDGAADGAQRPGFRSKKTAPWPT